MKLKFNYRYIDIGKICIHANETNLEWTLTHRIIKHKTTVTRPQNITAFKKYSLNNLLNEL